MAVPGPTSPSGDELDRPKLSRDDTKQLRVCIAEVLSRYKAYDVPEICERFGLPGGTGEEAFRSKLKYVEKRLIGIAPSELLEIASRLILEDDDFELTEIVAKINERREAQITELTRRRITGEFERNPLCTIIEPLDLLSRIWPIGSMRAPNAGWDEDVLCMGDAINKYHLHQGKWTVRDVLEVLGFYTCSIRTLVTFLEMVTSPLAHTPERQAVLVSALNEHLRNDGYYLKPNGKTSGAAVYAVRSLPSGAPADAVISEALAQFDPDSIHQRWVAALERRAGDPEGAITLARTLLEDVCKFILHREKVAHADDADLPTLYKLLSKALKLAPDDYSEKIFKQILGSCQSVVEQLGALRNKLGDAHSLGPKRARPLPRHAELAVNLSGSMATFLVSTWKARRDASPVSEPK